MLRSPWSCKSTNFEMTLQISIILHNINGTKNEDTSIDDVYENFDVIYLQETLLTTSSRNILHWSFIHSVFTFDAVTTRDRPSGGLPWIKKKKHWSFEPIPFYSDEHILAARVNSTVFANVYLPFQNNTVESINKFAITCKSLKSVMNRVKENNLIL